jgi:hypothetical protein
MQNTVYCLASTEPQANDIFTHLRSSGFRASDFSVVLKQKETKNVSMEENAVHSAETEGLVGGALGVLAGFTWFAIPAVGPFVASGWFVAALAGTALGGVVRRTAGGSGAFTLMGIPQNAIPRLHYRLHRGSILIAVHSHDPARRDKALRIFKSARAEDIYPPQEDLAA